MMKIAVLKKRLNDLEGRLSDYEYQIEDLTGRLGGAPKGDYDRMVSDIALTRLKADTTKEQIDQIKEAIKAEEAIYTSSEYKDKVKKLEDIDKSISKISDDISQTYDNFRGKLEDFESLCDDYDKLSRELGLTDTNTWRMSSYRWSAYLYSKMTRISKKPSSILI